jgi:tRNA-specific 2-thiouridylase
VDSAVAAALLKEQGYDVVGVTLNLVPSDESDEREDACCSLAAVEDARRVADQIGIPHYALNLREAFAETVIADFVAEYRRGRTPNPCIQCNRHVKFGALLQRTRALGAEAVATGHYARIERSAGTGRYRLRRGLDPAKDQSYVLYVLSQSQLARTLLPLGGLTKAETRAIARRLGLRVAEKKESQEICFVPNDDYGAYLRAVAPEALAPGEIVDLDGRVRGEHRGIALYTRGQRRGLGIAAPEPLYVIGLDVAANRVVVGPESALYEDEVVADEANLIGVESIAEPIRVQAKLRYRMPPADGWLSQLRGGELYLRLDEPQRAVTPGQAMVCYVGDEVIAGGTIRVNEEHR